jgi:hypothetical protein
VRPDSCVIDWFEGTTPPACVENWLDRQDRQERLLLGQ